VLRGDLFSTARCERCESTDNLEPKDRRLRTDPADPIEQAERNEPTDPTNRADPTLPIERMDPFDATERTEFSEANDHREDVGGFIVVTLTPVPCTASDDNALGFVVTRRLPKSQSKATTPGSDSAVTAPRSGDAGRAAQGHAAPGTSAATRAGHTTVEATSGQPHADWQLEDQQVHQPDP
jgi:hypothetical protein